MFDYDPKDLLFYDREAKKIRGKINELSTREFFVSMENNSSTEEYKKFVKDFLIECEYGDPKEATSMGNYILNKYFVKQLVGDICD